MYAYPRLVLWAVFLLFGVCGITACGRSEPQAGLPEPTASISIGTASTEENRPTDVPVAQTATAEPTATPEILAIEATAAPFHPIWINHPSGEGPDFGTVQFIQEDSAGRLWFVTNLSSGGASHYELSRLSEDGWKSVAESSLDLIVSDLHLAADGTVWISADESVVKVDTMDQITEYRRTETPLDGYVRTIAESPEGTLWFGFLDRGLVSLSPDGTWTDYTPEAGADYVSFDNTPAPFQIFATRSGDIWVADFDSLRHRDVEGNWTIVRGETSDKYEKVWSILETTDGTLWFRTFDTIEWLTPDGEWHSYIPNNPVGMLVAGMLAEAGDDSIWAVSGPELIHLDAQGQTTLFQLPLDAENLGVLAMFATSDGSLWLSVYRQGVYRFDSQGNWTLFSMGDGLLSYEVHSIFEASDGSLWFGTDKGVSHMIAPDSSAMPQIVAQATAVAEAADVAIAAVIERTSERVVIPAGTFEMGCAPGDDDCSEIEKPLHTVDLGEYAIDVYEVSNARYQACVTAGGCTPKSEPDRTLPEPDFPITEVTWDQASAFCIWNGGRLPTEAEWEKAARGAEDTRIYPWGNNEPDCNLANLGGCRDITPLAVGSYPASVSPYGVHDMAGNVDEWVNDFYDEEYYATSPVENPTGPSRGEYRVIRGGVDHSMSSDMRISQRAIEVPTYGRLRTGFRCVYTP